MRDQRLLDGTLKKGFETEERARAEDRLRVEILREHGGQKSQQLAGFLEQADVRNRPWPTLASSWWCRRFRLHVLGEQLKILAPYIGQLLDDPYSAVRYIAYRSLKRLPGFQTFSYDFMGASPQRMLAPKQVWDRWSRRLASTGGRTGERILIEANGDLQQEPFERLLRRRDDRSIDLQE